VTALLLALALGAGANALVDVQKVVPRAVLAMDYATPNNFLHQAVYAHARCLLRPQVAQALAQVEAQLEAQGFRLELWDCYRPLSVQRAMWKLVPVRGLVADPDRGGSHHNRGTAVDASLVDLAGDDVAMPSAHDDFTRAGRRDSPCKNPQAAKHRSILRAAMEAAGFTTIKMEWWHFDAPNAGRAPLLDQPL
jgi:zinc D-Ala-D-Ala dipeptidase